MNLLTRSFNKNVARDTNFDLISLIFHVSPVDLFHWKYFKFKLWLKYLFVPIFVVFVTDDPHFDRMFKMVLIFTECLKWSSFSQFVFYLVLFCNAV